MMERTLWLELPLQMLQEIDELIEELYSGELSSVYDNNKFPPVRVAFIHKGNQIPIDNNMGLLCI